MENNSNNMYGRWLPSTMSIAISYCASCAKSHFALEFIHIFPPENINGVNYDYWGRCPNTDVSLYANMSGAEIVRLT